MVNLSKLKEKAVKSIQSDDSGKNSYLIINFTDDSKLNVSSFPYNDKGSARLDIEYEHITPEEIKNQKIFSISEELDSDKTEKLIIVFKNGGKMIVKAYNVTEEGTAGLETVTYISNNKKLVAESLIENEYRDGRHGNYIMNSPQYEEIENNNKTMETFVDENIDEFEENYQDEEYFDEDAEENIEDEEEDYTPLDKEENKFGDEDENDDEIDLSQITIHSDENENENEIDEVHLENLINNQLEVPEFSRETLQFRTKGSKDIIEGIPMAIMSGGKFVLFKTANGLKKIALGEIITESENPRTWVKESINYYK